MRILMIVSNDVVHDGRVLKEAKALSAAGHDVRFIGWDRSGRAPERTTWEGLEIRYVRTRGLLRVLGRDVLRNPAWWRRADMLARREPFDAVHCHDLDTLPIGVRLKKSFRTPLVYDAHEVFGYMIEHDVPRFVTDYAFRMERRLAPQVDRVIAVNDFVKAYIDSVSGHEAIVVRNCPEVVLPEYRSTPSPPFTLLYIGTLHPSRFVLEAIETVAEMPEISLVVGGSKALTPIVRDMCARQPNTRFVGVVPNTQVLPMTVDSHAVLSMFDPAQRINQVGLPNKIFEAMAAGRPSIVAQGLPMSDLVLRERCGLAVPYTKTGLRSAIEQLRKDLSLAETLGRNGLEAAKQRYNWPMESKKLIAIYSGLRP